MGRLEKGLDAGIGYGDFGCAAFKQWHAFSLVSRTSTFVPAS